MITKLSCLPVSLYSKFFDRSLSIQTWSNRAKKLGLDAIDINALFLKDMSEEEIKQIRSELALPVFMVSAYSDFTNPSAEKREQILHTAIQDMYNSSAIGAEYIRLTIGQHHPDCDDSLQLSYARECFEKCSEISRETGLKILLENHSKPGAWDYPDYVFDIDRFIAAVNVLEDLPVAINFDTANAYALGDWKKVLNAVAGKIDTIHINDLKSVSPLAFELAGNGIVPIPEIVSAVLDTGFNGGVSLEEASFLDWYGIARGIDYTKCLFDKIDKE